MIAVAVLAQGGGDASSIPAATPVLTLGQRFVAAAKDATAGRVQPAGSPPAMTAYVMIDLPPVGAAADQRRIAIEFRDVRADALAKFYTEVCQREAPDLARDCEGRPITISTSENVPVGQACRIMEGALVAVCAPSS